MFLGFTTRFIRCRAELPRHLLKQSIAREQVPIESALRNYDDAASPTLVHATGEKLHIASNFQACKVFSVNNVCYYKFKLVPGYHFLVAIIAEALHA